VNVQEIQERSRSAVHWIRAVAAKMSDDEFPADLGLDQARNRNPGAAHFGNRPWQQGVAEPLANQVDQQLFRFRAIQDWSFTLPA
jgi:hypothetical protein